MKQAQFSSFGVAFCRAVAGLYPEESRILNDPYADKFLPGFHRFFYWRMKSPKPFKKLMAMREKITPGLMGWMFCRTRYIDDKLEEAIKKKQVEVVVNLGSGMDTRCLRIPGIETTPYIEVDHPDIIAYKQKRIKKHMGKLPENVHYVPMNFNAQNIENELKKAGYSFNQKSFFIWEGVTQYITQEANEKTLALFSKAAKESKIVFTYVKDSFIQGREIPQAYEKFHKTVRKKNIWVHGYNTKDLPKILNKFNLELIEDIGNEVFRKKYIEAVKLDLQVFGIERIALAKVKG